MNKYFVVIAVNFLIKSKEEFLFQSHSIRHLEDIEVVYGLHQNHIILGYSSVGRADDCEVLAAL